MTKLDNILKSRDITLPTKVCLVKPMVFPVVMYECESWTVKKAECRRIDPFELWCWRRVLRVPWTARRSTQSILKEISLGVHWKDSCWSWNSSTLASSCKGLTHWKGPWFWEGLRAGGEGDNRGWDDWMASLTQWTCVWVNSGSWWWTGGLARGDSWGRKESDMTERLNWIELRFNLLFLTAKVVFLWPNVKACFKAKRKQNKRKRKNKPTQLFASICGPCKLCSNYFPFRASRLSSRFTSSWKYFLTPFPPSSLLCFSTLL